MARARVTLPAGRSDNASLCRPQGKPRPMRSFFDVFGLPRHLVVVPMDAAPCPRVEAHLRNPDARKHQILHPRSVDEVEVVDQVVFQLVQHRERQGDSHHCEHPGRPANHHAAAVPTMQTIAPAYHASATRFWYRRANHQCRERRSASASRMARMIARAAAFGGTRGDSESAGWEDMPHHGTPIWRGRKAPWSSNAACHVFPPLPDGRLRRSGTGPHVGSRWTWLRPESTAPLPLPAADAPQTDSAPAPNRRRQLLLVPQSPLQRTPACNRRRARAPAAEWCHP